MLHKVGGILTGMPGKLNTVAIRIAARGGIERVDTQVAMALGASVQPLTRITPMVNKDTMASGGLPVRDCIKSISQYS